MTAPKGADLEEIKELAKRAGAAISGAVTFENLAKVTVHLPDTVSQVANTAVKALDSHVETLKERQKELYSQAQNPDNSKAAQWGDAFRGLGADLEQFAAEAARDTIKEVRGESTGRGEVHSGGQGLAGLYETRSTYGGYAGPKDKEKKDDKAEVESRAKTPEATTPGATSMMSAAAAAGGGVGAPGSLVSPPSTPAVGADASAASRPGMG